ncbi:MAG TPA: hypothetical protein VF799_01660, partial [Geobacteraceae bacterium]
KSPENASAFICALSDSGALRVYVPCLLSESGNILVYVPERQPEGRDELADTIQDAVEFIEAVGFMMEPVSLASDRAGRENNLKFIPVLTPTD